MIKYVSTRGGGSPVSFLEAFAAGLAPDGGLYVPQRLPRLPTDLRRGDAQPYAAEAFDFFRLFDGEHPGEELAAIMDASYGSFSDDPNAPLVQLDQGLFVLELFHGPTLAFKDFGLQLLGNLFQDQIRRTGEAINVLGATSGDTGAAAIHGLAGKEGANVFILYPEGRISPLQERQMTCTGAANIFPIPIKGTFDDAQRIVKEIFGDAEVKQKLYLSAINSINLVRVLAQAVYYVHAFLQLPEECRDNVNFVVPTGNFGNVFAAWMAHRMGLPTKRLTVATNRNDILFRFFNSGVYAPSEVVPSWSPSMDIQVASNFERLLYYECDEDGEKVASLMRQAAETGRVEVPDFDPGIFTATRCDDDGIIANIRRVHETYDYIVDPHTACGFQDIDSDETTVVLATAHPAKFPETIHKAIGQRPTHPALDALKKIDPVRYPLPANAAAVREFIETHAAGRA